MSKFKFLLAIIISLTLLQCSQRSNPTDSHEQPIDLPAVEKKLVNSNNEFGLKFFREINKTEKGSNIFISPLSVSMCLGMVYNGAAGETQNAMHQTLEFGDLSIQEVNECYKYLMDSLTQLDPEVDFRIANSIWYRIGLTPIEKFVNACKNYFNALVKGLDFNSLGAADTINFWIEENTNGKIKNMVSDPISPSIMNFLINAIYFKGIWTYEFNKDQTEDGWFYPADGIKKSCKMMSQRGLFNYFENDTFQAVDLPYGNGDFSMTILLPKKGIDIDSLIAEFTQENLDLWLNSFESDSGDIYLPKFKLEYKKLLAELLSTLGMGIAFSHQADLSKMYEDLNVWIGEVIHKTFVEVNEEGTEAAAVTVVIVVTSYDPASSGFCMRINQPFIFLIREHQSQTILFVGKITDPVFE